DCIAAGQPQCGHHTIVKAEEFYKVGLRRGTSDKNHVVRTPLGMDSYGLEISPGVLGIPDANKLPHRLLFLFDHVSATGARRRPFTLRKAFASLAPRAVQLLARLPPAAHPTKLDRAPPNVTPPPPTTCRDGGREGRTAFERGSTDPFHCSEAGYPLGSDRDSPNHGSTLL